MAIPAGATRIVFSGDMPNGEIWSTGFWMQGDAPTSAAEANALALLAYDEFSATDGSGGMYATLVNLMNAATSWNQVNVYVYPTGGPTATFVGQYILPTVALGSATAHNPNQVALVITLRTGLSGRSHRGRMYLPATGVPMAADGQVSQATIDAVVNAWAAAFSDWNGASEGKIVVVSTKLTASTPVSVVSADSRADIQRSRANSEAILRTYSYAVTP